MAGAGVYENLNFKPAQLLQWLCLSKNQWKLLKTILLRRNSHLSAEEAVRAFQRSFLLLHLVDLMLEVLKKKYQLLGFVVVATILFFFFFVN